MKYTDIEEQRYQSGMGVTVRQAAAGMVVFALAALLLNADALYHNAELLEYGRGRDLCLVVMTPVKGLGDWLRFTGLRRLMEAVAPDPALSGCAESEK